MALMNNMLQTPIFSALFLINLYSKYYYIVQKCGLFTMLYKWKGRDPGVVVKTACLESQMSRVLAFKCPRRSVLGFRPTGLEFGILCLDDGVISFISPFSGDYSGPV